MVYSVEVVQWKVFMDGASNVLGAGAGIVVITAKKIKLDSIPLNWALRTLITKPNMKPCLPD